MFAALKTRYDAFAERVLASLSEIEREDVRSFDRWFYASGGWRWLVGIVAATTFFAWIASQLPVEHVVRRGGDPVQPRRADAAVGRACRRGSATAVPGQASSATSSLGPLLALVGAFVGAGIAGLVKGVDPLAWLQDSAKLRHVVIAGLVFGVAVLARRRADRAPAQPRVHGARRAPRGRARGRASCRASSPSRSCKLLQLQIEPHFLFNTLGSAQQLAETRRAGGGAADRRT